ncbi:MAG: hypothetical protein IJ399_04095 [Bacilli bacterium]|nr:hypothetical protein [Bacilli bacterium]
MNKNYDDIINLPHYVSKKRPQMSIEARSAQFAPFAALTGYDEQVKETARLTNKKIELEEGQKEILNNKLLYILENINSKPEITFTYFVKDNKKSGGKYIDKTGIIRKIDMIEQYIQFTDKSKIDINDVLSIESELFSSYE